MKPFSYAILSAVFFAALHFAVPVVHAATPPKRDIKFAFFPMAVPVNTLAETMKRDRILRRNLSKLGKNIQFVPLAKGHDALVMIRQGQIDAVSFSDLPTIEAAAVNDMQVLGFVKQSYSSVVTRKGIQLTDLRKKKIGNVHGSTSHYALLHALNSVGLKERDVNLVHMEAAEIPDAIASGKIDAFAAWEPTPTVVLSKDPNLYSIVHRQVSLSYFLISKQLVEKHPAEAQEIAAALIRAIRWMKKNKENLNLASSWALGGMAQFTGKQPQLTVTDIAKLTNNDLLVIPGAPLLSAFEKGTMPLLEKEFEFMKQQKLLPDHAAWETARPNFKPDFLQRIASNPAKFELNRFDYEK